MMSIALYHKHYNAEHLEAVKKEMEVMGAPEIRAIWSEMYGLWMAVEGCHRIRAAKELGLEPVIIDISDEETTMIQYDGDDIEVAVADLAEELTDNACKTEIINF